MAYISSINLSTRKGVRKKSLLAILLKLSLSMTGWKTMPMRESGTVKYRFWPKHPLRKLAIWA